MAVESPSKKTPDFVPNLRKMPVPKEPLYGIEDDVYTNLSEDAVLAVGNGFSITKEDVESLREFMSESVISSADQFLDGAVRLRIYFEECKRLGLMGKTLDETESDTTSLKRLFRYRKRYLTHLLMNQEVPDIVVESFYRSHYSYSNAPPLDDSMKKEIADQIRWRNVNYTVYKNDQKLKTQYNVTVCFDNPEACKQ